MKRTVVVIFQVQCFQSGLSTPGRREEVLLLRQWLRETHVVLSCIDQANAFTELIFEATYKEVVILVSCPYCKAPGYECHKNGHNPGGTQRWHCRLCHRHFTPEVRSKKQKRQEEARLLYAEPGMSARAVAEHLNVHHQTVLRWLGTGKRQKRRFP